MAKKKQILPPWDARLTVRGIPRMSAGEMYQLTSWLVRNMAEIMDDPNAVAEELRDSTGVLLAVYDPDHGYLSAAARFTLAEVIAIAEADYRDCC